MISIYLEGIYNGRKVVDGSIGITFQAYVLYQKIFGTLRAFENNINFNIITWYKTDNFRRIGNLTVEYSKTRIYIGTVRIIVIVTKCLYLNGERERERIILGTASKSGQDKQNKIS